VFPVWLDVTRWTAEPWGFATSVSASVFQVKSLRIVAIQRKVSAVELSLPNN